MRFESDPERYDPLPGFLQLPGHAWRKLSRPVRIGLGLLAVAALVALAVTWPEVEEDKRAGAQERAQEAAARKAAAKRALLEDQRPRRATLGAAARTRIRAAGGLTDAGAAALAGGALETAIARDVRTRIAAGDLEGPLLDTACDPVRERSPRGANYNCFALTDRTRTADRTFETGYRFSARAELAPPKLVWCKENPRPLHPTSHVLSIPISPECR